MSQKWHWLRHSAEWHFSERRFHHNDTRHNGTPSSYKLWHLYITLTLFQYDEKYCYAEKYCFAQCNCVERYYTKCHTECRCAECRHESVIVPSVIMLNVIILYVVMPNVMRLCHPPDGSTSPKYKLLCLIITKKICKEKNALAFNRDRCCHLVLCLQLIPFHYAESHYVKRHYAEFLSAECHHTECLCGHALSIPHSVSHAECHYVECHYDECHYAEFHNAKRHYAEFYCTEWC